MKKQALLFAFVMILGSVVAFSTGALAPDPLAAAPGGGGGGGGGGGEDVIPDYGDLFILYRDADGVPELTPLTQVEVPDEEGNLVSVDAGLCQQPIAADADFPGCADLIAGGEATEDCRGIPVDQVTCAVAEGSATYTQEVDFGRINEVRSPASVFESQLEDATFKLATADATSLDAAGRMVACTATDGAATIDSPLQNLAIYKQLMTTGSLGVAIPGNPLETAARGLGVASDKTGEVTVDLVAYVNQMLGLTDLATTHLGAPTCIQVREEVMGEVQLVDKCFLNYGSYGYARGANFGGLPTAGTSAGTFEYLDHVNNHPENLFKIYQGSIWNTVFDGENGFTEGNIGGFAQAADDTRAVIDFMHSNPVPLDHATEVTCEAAEGITHYDLSISDVSGLQVPVRLVAGTEGREFIVTVANGGPNDATGTVMVEALDQNDGLILRFTEDLAIAAGTSQSWTVSFSIPKPTTITGIDWTATAVPDPLCENSDGTACEVNSANNSVTAFTTVIAGGGGGGGH